MKKTKFKPELLNEELKKFRLLCEYDFYQEKKEAPEYKDIILGSSIAEEEGDAQNDEVKPVDDTEGAADVANQLGVDTPSDGSEENMTDMPEPDMTPEPEPVSDDVEVDVTSLVKGSQEAKDSADAANKKSEELLQKLTNLEARVASMSKLNDKIDGLEREFIKRNPTPVEKLEMRSLSSAPFNQKLGDYWSEKEGAYDVMNTEKKPKEYILTKDDVNVGYNDATIQKSFSPKSYDEENLGEYEVEEY
jgi:hypothetical protein